MISTFLRSVKSVNVPASICNLFEYNVWIPRVSSIFYRIITELQPTFKHMVTVQQVR